MANIRRIENKSGLSFQITVTQGRDKSGKQMRHFKTWKPAQGMTERQALKAVEKIAFDFEEQIKQGLAPDNKLTFAQYAETVLERKEKNGLKTRSVEDYKATLKRINPAIGHLKLQDIRPAHLNQFYANLQENGIRTSVIRATAKKGKDIKALLKEKKITIKKLSEMSGISVAVLSNGINNGYGTLRTAEAIATALGHKVEALYTIEQNTSPLSASTIGEYHKVISLVLREAEKEMLIPYNPASKASAPKKERAGEKDIKCFQPEEIARILEALKFEPIFWQALTHLLIVTGCRRGEIAGLKWNAINWKENTIKIDCTLNYSKERGVYENSAKTGKVRYISLPQETIKLLKDYQASAKLMSGNELKETDYVFSNENGVPIYPSTITGWLERFSKKHNLPECHPHKFRHTVASVLIFNGIDTVSVSKRLGHSKTSTTTDIYSHFIAEAEARTTDCIADVLLRKQA